MLSNSDIKRIRSLREKKFREELGLFVVEGEKMVSEVLSSGLEVIEIYRREEIGEALMERLTQFSSPSPVLAVIKVPPMENSSVVGGLCVGLDSVRDPGNLGTIIRLCDWFGVSKLYLSEDCVELFNPKVIQSSMGSIFRVKTTVSNLENVCRDFISSGKKIYGTFLNGSDIYGQLLEGEGLVIMGNESSGISNGIATLVTNRLTIPRFPLSEAESLNVATASAVVLSEFRRR